MKLPDRTRKALERNPRILQLDGSLFLVESASAKAGLTEQEWYTVDIGEWSCECGDFVERGQMCYHIRAVILRLHHGDEIERV